MNEVKSVSPAVSLDHLTISYGKNKAIQDFSLSIIPGDNLALLGIKGSGKSSLIYAMMGFIRPDGGKACVAGFDCWTQSLDVRRCCGYVPTFPNLDKAYSINELLTFSAGLRQGATDWDLVQSMVDRFHLDPRKTIRLIDPMEKNLLVLSWLLWLIQKLFFWMSLLLGWTRKAATWLMPSWKN